VKWRVVVQYAVGHFDVCGFMQGMALWWWFWAQMVQVVM
jgi:hypothetical protein